MPETSYEGLSIDESTETVYVPRDTRSKLSRSRSVTRRAMNHADQYIQIAYTRAATAFSITKKAAQGVSWWTVSKIGLLHVGALGAVVATVVCLSYVGQIPTLYLNASWDSGGSCRPDGTFEMGILSDSWTGWSASGFFQITIGFGSLSFTTVKVIDIIWDVVVGRGVQTLLAIGSYIIFSKSLLRIMEHQSVSYRTFEVLGFQTASAESISKLFVDFRTNHGLRARLSIAWIIISSVYVVSFPTLISAMTGYSANQQAFVKDKSGNLALWSSFEPVQYVLRDGGRVGLSEPYLATNKDAYTDPYNYDARDDCGNYGGNVDSGNIADNENGTIVLYIDWDRLPPRCRLLYHICEYVMQYGFNGTNKTESTFNKSGELIDLKSPTLNVSVGLTTPTFWRGPGSWWAEAATGSDGVYRAYDSSPSLGQAVYSLGGDMYDPEYIAANGSCQPLTTYKWGFSFLLLFITALSTAIWAVGMYFLWLDAYLYSRFDHAGRDMGTHRAALDFAAAMRKDIGEDATEEMSNSELERRVRRGLNGWRVGYDMMDGEKVPLARAQEASIFWRTHGWRTWSTTQRIVICVVCTLVFVLGVLLPVALSFG